MKDIKIGTPVVVTTKYRGVFYGRFDGLFGGEDISLKGARNCIWWCKEVGGFIGLAKNGPVGNSTVGEPCDMPLLKAVTSILVCTKEAAELWESKGAC